MNSLLVTFENPGRRDIGIDMFVCVVVGFILYFVVGVGSAFIRSGECIRHRRKVMSEWKRELSFGKLRALSLCAVVLWPLSSFWERKELECWLSAIQNRYPISLPYALYEQVFMCLPSACRESLRKRLSELGYVVTGFVTGPTDEDVAVAVSIVAFDSPFTLVRLLDRDVSLWPSETRQFLLGDDDALALPPKALQWLRHSEDEIWEFVSDKASWRRSIGRAGLAKARNGVVIETYVMVFN